MNQMYLLLLNEKQADLLMVTDQVYRECQVGFRLISIDWPGTVHERKFVAIAFRPPHIAPKWLLLKGKDIEFKDLAKSAPQLIDCYLQKKINERMLGRQLTAGELEEMKY